MQFLTGTACHDEGDCGSQEITQKSNRVAIGASEEQIAPARSDLRAGRKGTIKRGRRKVKRKRKNADHGSRSDQASLDQVEVQEDSPEQEELDQNDQSLVSEHVPGESKLSSFWMPPLAHDDHDDDSNIMRKRIVDGPLPCPPCANCRPVSGSSGQHIRGALKTSNNHTLTDGVRERRVSIATSDEATDVREARSTKPVATLRSLNSFAETGRRGFSCFAHFLLSLIGGARQTRTSFQQAVEACQARESRCCVYVTIIVFGHFCSFALPLAFIFCGLTYVYQKGPRVEEIDEFLKLPVKQPYWMILITSILGAASTALIMGPPAFRTLDTGALQFIGRMFKLVFTLYLLYRTIYSSIEDLAEVQEIFVKEFSRHIGLSTLLRTLMFSMLQSGTSSQWRRYVDQFVLMLVYNDYLNFRKAHDADFYKNWSKYMTRVREAEGQGELTLEALKSRPYSDETGGKGGFAPSVLDPKRLVFLIQEMTNCNGLTEKPPWAKQQEEESSDVSWCDRLWFVCHSASKGVFTIYIVVLLVRCWTFGWCVGTVYLPLFAILYPWVIILVLIFMILMRLFVVELLLRILIIRQNNEGCLERVQALWRLCCCCDGESKLKGLTPELEIETPDGKLAQMMLYHCPGQDAATSDSSVVEEGYYSTKYREKTLCLMTLANAMASTGFLPGNFDRAIWPGLLYTTILSEKATEEELKRNYEKEVEVLRATGITRDGWCYVIVYAAVGKVMVDFMVAVLSRFMAGVGYFDCLVVTLTDRTWQSWIEQLNLMDTMNQIIQWVNTIW